ncbi:hypothetical protein DTL70_27525 [Streptomyces diacarni]|uniref:DNA primase n=1 Tax=Streptomyces diacarni TaxID=2800381 RepID=A0A367EGU4_9ACTN|nr:hypothetical protein [Streptomyces diacarni]RCG17326.1 hypothetical protein DTL70_27525 [Streptomyces diacarni]
MNDSCKTAVLAGVAGGYLLGRTKKAKLALAVGSLVAGRRLGLDPQELISKGVRKITETPQFEELADQVKDQMMAAARTAAGSVANRRIESLTDSLRARTDRLGGHDGQGGQGEQDGGEGREEGRGEGREEGRGEGEDEDSGEAEGARWQKSSRERQRSEDGGEGGESSGASDGARRERPRRAAASKDSGGGRARQSTSSDGSSAGRPRKKASSSSSARTSADRSDRRRERRG